MKIIRLWGVVAFFAVLLLIAALGYFIAPKIIKDSIETIGSEALGAQVNVDDVSLALFPLGIEIGRLQATDKDQPMQNLFEVKTIKFAIDTSSLMWKKILIDELTMEGIQLATERTESGALENGTAREKIAKQVASFDLPELTEDDIKDRVNKADLITLKRLKELDASQQRLKMEWEAALDKDKFNQRTAEIKKEFKRLTARAKKNKMNLLTDRKAWKKLKKKIDAERKLISGLNKKLAQDKNNLQAQIKGVKNGPKDDLQAIMSDMGLGNGIAGLSDKFLGPEFTPWVEKIIEFTQGMESEQGTAEESAVYSTSNGLKVQFKDKQLFPDLLIKKLSLSGNDPVWELAGNGSNIGYFPWLINDAAKLDLSLDGKNKSAANIALVSQWKTSKEMLTKIDSRLSQWKVEKLKLMQTEQGEWFVNSGLLDAELSGDLTLEKVNLKLSINLSQPNFSAPEGITGWQKSFAKVLNQQKSLAVKVTATGSLQDPKIKIDSSIEKLFAEAIGEKIQQQAKKLTDKFSSAIASKVGDLGSVGGALGDFDQWGDQLKLNDDLLKDLKGG